MSSSLRLRALGTTAVCAVVCMLAAAALAAPAGAASFRTVDVTGAFGTDVFGVNDSGTVVGVFMDDSGTLHSFIEQPGRQPTVIDDPNAVYTGVTAINDAGTAVGEVYSPASGSEGFIRSRDGSFTTLDYPSAPGLTQLTGINDSGLLLGAYQDAAGSWHGFVDNQGTFTTIDDPAALTGVLNGGTYPLAINNSGAIVGNYLGADNLQHGFVYRDGTFTNFDGPNAGTNSTGGCGGFDYGNPQGTAVEGISASGVIVGSVCNDIGPAAPNAQYGWLLSHDQFSSFNDPDAGPGLSYPNQISENGRMVAGTYVTPPDLEQGFVATLTP